MRLSDADVPNGCSHIGRSFTEVAGEEITTKMYIDNWRGYRGAGVLSNPFRAPQFNHDSALPTSPSGPRIFPSLSRCAIKKINKPKKSRIHHQATIPVAFSLGVIQVSGQSGSESDSVFGAKVGTPRNNDANPAYLFFSSLS